MKKLVLTLLAAALIAGSLATNAAAIEVSGDAYAGVYSRYVWRGFDLSADDALVIQGGADISAGGFTMGWWGNMSENSGDVNEVDIVLDYSTDLSETVSLSVGNILYDVDGLSDTNELYLGLGLNVPLSPALTIYRDYDEFDTTYITLGLGQDLSVNEQLSLSFGATGSYLMDDPNGFGTKDEWFHNVELSVAADYAVNDQVSVGVSYLYTTPLSNDARDYAGISDEYTYGAAATLSF